MKIIGSVKEDFASEKRVSVTPETVKRKKNQPKMTIVMELKK